ncbi:hypothetical protein HXX76_016107 [Chlamydomonas incerta]|uniref:Guanylate cyclase domain-containing protein n=1 Tax=Chlamydomonas incerta TaxID=51695 RepID=A0A835S7U3_CHLIN|nr:hypothetical protein HXX76_016107 [Chlamydomonas incerta]|eukprot:KAG2422347.1 hypothetical protein HXX76_016107 [Chlamydomonas incerta]
MQQAFSPSITLEIQVQQQPYFPELMRSFEFVASRLLSKVLPGMIASLQLAPNGVTQAIYPLAGNEAAIGHDLLADPSRRDDALRAIAYGNLTVAGPYKLLQGGFGVVLRQPVFVTPPAGAAGWALDGYNGSSSGSSSSASSGQASYGNGTEQCDPTFGAKSARGDCPGTSCYDPATGRRFWGFAQGLARLDGLLQGNDARMQRLSQYGPWHLTRVSDNGTESQLASSAGNGSSVGSGRCDSVADSPNGRDADSGGPCVSVAVVLPNALWRLYLGKQGGWQPPWRAGLLALVVVGSFVVSGLLFGLLVSSSRHRSLLQAMFPQKVLAPLQQGKNFSEEFESCTILFTDIVAYTTLSGQMKPIEVAEMLNELYTIFDEICERNGCYKVETIGDAFVAVGGCPDAEPPEVAAERVAHMALDMVAATAGFTSSQGHRLRIRVGLASGPIAAAVIGVKMPRYCLFGDTVNMASRMESNSDPQRINLAPATAALLRGCASAAAFAIIPRGQIIIKGKGPLECFWLEPAVQSGSTPQMQLAGAGSLASLGSWELLQPRQSLHSMSGGGALAEAAPCSAPGTLREARGRLSLAAMAAAAASAARQSAGSGGAAGGAAATAATAAAAAAAAGTYSTMPAALSMYSSAPNTSTSMTLAMASSPGAAVSPLGSATAADADYLGGMTAVARDSGTGAVSLTLTPGASSPAADFGYGERLAVAGAPGAAAAAAAPPELEGGSATSSHHAPNIGAPAPASAELAPQPQPQPLQPLRPPGSGAPSAMAALGGGGGGGGAVAGAVAAGHSANTGHGDDIEMHSASTIYPDTTSLPLPATLMLAHRGSTGIGVAAGAAAVIAAAARSPSSRGRGTQLTSGSGSTATTMGRTYTATTNSTLSPNSMLTPSITPGATTLGGLSGYSIIAGGGSNAAGGSNAGGAGAMPAGSGEWNWQQQHILLIRAGISNADSDSAAALNPNHAAGTACSGVEVGCSHAAVALGPCHSAVSVDVADGAADRPSSSFPTTPGRVPVASTATEARGAANGDEKQQPWKIMATAPPPAAPAGRAVPAAENGPGAAAAGDKLAA